MDILKLDSIRKILSIRKRNTTLRLYKAPKSTDAFAIIQIDGPQGVKCSMGLDLIQARAIKLLLEEMDEAHEG